MREEDSNWFAKCEEELPSPEELIPLSQSLITPDLAIAFDLRNSDQQPPPPPPTKPFRSSEQANSSAADSIGDETARTLKRPRLVWTPQLHKRFVDAVAHLGIKNAVPKTIMQLMSVDGLTRENVASHLQKYRLYLKRMQSGGGGGNTGESDHLFASLPVPSHFLHPATSRQSSDHFIKPIATYHQPPQFLHRQISAANFASLTKDQSMFLSRQIQQQPLHLQSQVANYNEDLESVGTRTTVLTLFPTQDD